MEEKGVRDCIVRTRGMGESERIFESSTALGSISYYRTRTKKKGGFLYCFNVIQEGWLV